MSGINYPKFGKVLDNLQKLGEKKNLISFRVFAVMHQDNQEELAKIATNEPDYRIRAIAVEKLVCEDTLFQIAQEDSEYKIQKTAISKITSPKKLMMLRLSADSSLQPLIQDRYNIIKSMSE